MTLNQAFLDRYEDFGIQTHNVAEIKQLRLLSFEDEQPTIHHNHKLVLVLVEPRILTRPVFTRLQRLKQDLLHDGFHSRFIGADLYRDLQLHQDGRCVLALRSFFQAVKKQYRNFKGAILIGDFPEAMLVRRCAWFQEPANPDQWLQLGDTRVRDNYLMFEPEIVAHRTDIVLGDLHGNWAGCYRQGPESLESFNAIAQDQNWLFEDGEFSSTRYERTQRTFSDFFWLDECEYSITEGSRGRIDIQYSTELANPEVGSADRGLPNPIARPDIHISRINARHVALDPNPGFRDVHGNGFLGADGKPQTVETDGSVTEERVGDLRSLNPSLERTLLCEYLDRNHAWRTGAIQVPEQCASIAYAAPGDGFDAGAYATELGCGEIGSHADALFDDANLIDYVDFLEQPAMIKGVLAHSGALTTHFGDDYVVELLEKRVGGKPWMWHKGQDNVCTPSLIDQKGRANLYLHRTLHANKILNNTSSSFYLHAGCNVNTPHNAALYPYSSPDYGWFQNAEGILFYLKGLGVISRAKTFNDRPVDFIRVFFGSRLATVGDAHYAFFEADAHAAELPSQKNKRSYTWGIVGDWTLKRRHKRVPTLRTHADSHAPDFFDQE